MKETLIKDRLCRLISEVVKSKYPDFPSKNITLEHPHEIKHGDFACNVALKLAGVVKKAPRDIASELMAGFKENNFIGKVEIAGPGFINFWLSPDFLVEELKNILDKKDTYGQSRCGNRETVVVEYSQPNTNKPQHIGHMRNNFLGKCLGNILDFAGFKVVLLNYAGDIGIHITKSMLAYMKWGKGETPESSGLKPDYFVGKYYVLFGEEAEKDPSLMDEAQELLRRWEKGDKEVRALWGKMNKWAYEGWEKTYRREGVTFDDWSYESDYSESGKEVVKEALEKGVAKRLEDGAVLAPLKEYGLDDKILLRRDGTSVYATKDLKLAEDTYEKYHFSKRVYCVASDQRYYLQQVFKVLELLGYEYAKHCYHLAYGVVYLPEGKMSSREGRVVYADDLMDQVCAKALTELDQRYADWTKEEKERVAEVIGIGALKYAMLKVDALQDIHFDLDKTVSFDGNTGPYLQYTYARICGILRKGDEKQKLSVNNFKEEQELNLLRRLYIFPEIIEEAAMEYRPHLIANYIFDLAQEFNLFYHALSVLQAEAKVRAARLYLVQGVAQVLKNGLELLGIDVLERM